MRRRACIFNGGEFKCRLEFERTPDTWIVGPEEVVFVGFLRVGGGEALGGFGFHDDDGADAAGIVFDVGVG